MDDKIRFEVEFDDWEMAALRQAADAHGRDIPSEVRAIVRETVARKFAKPPEIDFVEEFRRIRAMTPPGVRQTDSTKIIRESRDHDH